MSTVKQIRTAIEDMGYSRLPDTPARSPSDVWYQFTSSSSDAIQVLNLEFKPGSKTYGAWVGAYNPEAIKITRRILPTIREWLGTSTTNYLIDRQWPCWTLFDAGRGLATWQSSFFRIPDPSNRESCPLQVEDLKINMLDSMFWRIRDPLDILHLLSRSEKPYEWVIGYPIMRAAELLALAKVAGLGPDAALKRATEFREILAQNLSRRKDVASTDVDKMFSTFVEHIYM